MRDDVSDPARNRPTLSQPTWRRTGTGRASARVVAMCATMALVAAGCSDDDSQDVPPGDMAGPAVGTGDSGLEESMSVDPGELPEVELLEPGEGELREMRYIPTPGEPLRTEVVYTDENTSRFGEEPEQHTSTPPQRLVLTGTTEPGVNGAQTAVATVESLASEAGSEAESEAFASAAGFELTWDRTGPGALTEVEFAAPAEASDLARAATEVVLTALTDMTVVFPEEPVGVGARWTVTREVIDGVAPTRVTTYSLTEIEGDRVTVEVDGEAPVEAEQISTDTIGGDAVALDVTDYGVATEGELTVDLRGAVPADGQINEATTAEYSDPESGVATSFESSRTLTFTPAP